MICVCACVGKGEVNYTVPQDNTQQRTTVRLVRVQHTIKSKNQKAKTKQRSKKKITKVAKHKKRSSKQKRGKETKTNPTFFLHERCTVPC